ncbi:MAG TPA: chemotaxis protein CheB [Chloroflexota bacterium]|nr:chemotaxis protein CheB [Chloroflexota bacterium]
MITATPHSRGQGGAFVGVAAEQQVPQLVVVGSSAGGIEALGMLLSSLPTDFPAPIVIAQHIDPHRPSHLAEVLGRRSSLPIHTIDGREELQPGTVFVVPSNRHVQITDRDVVLRQDSLAGPKPSVDLLLRSAAEAYGEGLIAIILSGSGSDGAAGARVVKKHGGTVIIENPATAEFPGMPQSLAPTTVDIVANVDKIGPLVMEVMSGELVPPRGDAERTLETLLEDLRERSGIQFSSYKRPTIERRLRRRMAATDTHTLEQYMDYLESHPDEYQRLVNSFLIKVTDFFRDADLFDHLRTQIVPEIIQQARRRNNEIRIWSAGCATGEEAYSLGILVCEALGAELDNFHVRIFATDLDNAAVNFARRGVYQPNALNTVSPDIVARYFTEEDGQFEIRKRVRALMVFGQHDLGQRAPFPHIDLILCRNVLIYFTTELQRRALQLFAFALRNSGWLVMGKAESTSPLPEFFSLEQPSLKIYRRYGDRMLIPPARMTERPATPPRTALGRRLPSGRELSRPEARPQGRQSSDRLAEDVFRLSLGLVVVDAQYDVQHINEAARQLLGIHTSAVGDDFVHLAQAVPARQLRSAIDGTFRDRSVSTLPEVEIEDPASNERRYVDITCHPQASDADASFQLALIVVGDVTARVRQRRELEAAVEQARSESRTAREQIDRLIESNRELLEANAELTTVNMELRSANEEFLVNNEEVQAATEEVETLNEELQSTNEELETLNEELQATVEELNTTNDDLQSRSSELQELAAIREDQRRQLEDEKERLEVILASMGSALLVVDGRGQRTVTNAAYDNTFGSAELRPEDAEGRPLPEAEWPQRRAAAGESFRMEFTQLGTDGQRRWYEAMGNPLRAHDGNGQRGGSGAVIVIRDVTDRSLLRLQEEFLDVVSHELRTPLTALRGFLQLMNRAMSQEPEADPRRRYAQLAVEQERRLANLIDELVDMTRLRTGKLTLRPQEVDLSRLVATSVEIARSLAESRDISGDVPSEPLIARGDPIRLEQVLTNLLNNAVAHTRPEDRVEVRLRRLNGSAEIQVRDSGPGIPESELASLFNRYYQVRRGAASSGLGLGLFIVKQFVEAHGGEVRVESPPGQGTTFTVQLPLEGPPSA